MTLEHEELTGKIIAAAIEVHKHLGPGFLESIYENALVLQLRRDGVKVEQQVEVPVFYGGVEVGHHRSDLLVEDTNIVELKAGKDLPRCAFCHCEIVFESSWENSGADLEFF